MRRVLLLATLPVLALLMAAVLAATALVAAPAGAKAKTKRCSAAELRRDSAVGSKYQVKQTLKSGQYTVFRTQFDWTICDAKAGPKRRYRSYTFDLDGQKNVGVKAFSRPGKCLAVQLRPTGSGYPSVPAINMGDPTSGATVNQIDRQAPGAQILKVELASTCLLGVASRSADGSRGIYLSPVVGPNFLIDQFKLSAQATDADLRALSLDGNKVSWTDAGKPQSKQYVGTR